MFIVKRVMNLEPEQDHEVIRRAPSFRESHGLARLLTNVHKDAVF